MPGLIPANVIDKNGYKLEFVLVKFDTDGWPYPIYYDLPFDASLVLDDVPIALSMIKPRWTGTAWEETATPEEIAEREAKHPVPPPSAPTLTERTEALECAMLALLGGDGNV